MAMEKHGVRPSDLPEAPEEAKTTEQPEDALKTAAEDPALQEQFETKSADKGE